MNFADTRDALSQMERDWDLRAREAPEYYIASARRQWRMDEFPTVVPDASLETELPRLC